MARLSQKQQEAKDFILKFANKEGRKPTYDEVAEGLGISKTAAWNRCQHIEAENRFAPKKRIEIQLHPRTKKDPPSFSYAAHNMERYEVIGILELAIAEIKGMCMSESEKRFPKNKI